ncbi:MAG: alanine--tRNA ligase, partial [Pseudomonadota bacterium]
GDYFKPDAIEFAWTLITRDFGLDKKRLLVTVYAEDDEAHALWKKIAGLSDDKIIRIPTSDNFWSMGDTGPCGPCSEIFYDHGDHIPGGPPGSPDEDGDRFIEIWNLVFMQFEQVTPDERVNLPRPSIDTGMGLERIAAVLQGTHDNYETDLFKALIQASMEETGVDAEGARKASHRVIADHLRASSFLISDGVLPSNEGRGYVLRRIMRRAMRHASLLGAREPLLHKLVPTLQRQMGESYPELMRAGALITETLKLEETRFRRTLEKGLSLLNDASGDLGKGDQLQGEVAFKLYDTYGFPLDLTQDALKARGVGVDVEAFNAAMERQRAEARAAWKGSGETATETVWYDLHERLGATEFLGYTTERAEGEIVALVADGATVDTLQAGEAGAVVVNQTPFYGESGGQVGDTGSIEAVGEADPSALFNVADTQRKLGALFVHTGTLERGTLRVGDAVALSVDTARRQSVRANHSATHLLHEALRTVLGDHVAQKGSLVAPDRLRFDFSHPKPVTTQEVEAVEALANAVIVEDTAVTTRLMAIDDAMESGARALFGEKYGDEVRVVSMGAPQGADERPWSIELCGGTHVARTGEIGLVHIVGESASSAGVRRLEALCGEAARAHLVEQEARVRAIAAALKVKPDDAVERLAAVLAERRQLERQLADAKRQLALGGGVPTGSTGDGASSGDGVRTVGAIKFLGRTLEGIAAKDLRGLVDDGKAQVGSGVVAVVTRTEDGKGALSVGVTDDLKATYNAVDLVKIGAAKLGGKGGGGRPDLAQAGGPDGDQADAALAAIEAVLAG